MGNPEQLKFDYEGEKNPQPEPRKTKPDNVIEMPKRSEHSERVEYSGPKSIEANDECQYCSKLFESEGSCSYCQNNSTKRAYLKGLANK